MKKNLQNIIGDESGVTSVEYALLAASAAAAVGVAGNAFYAQVSDALSQIVLSETVPDPGPGNGND